MSHDAAAALALALALASQEAPPPSPAPPVVVAPCHHPQPALIVHQPIARWIPFRPGVPHGSIPLRPGYPAVPRAGSYCPGGTG